MHKNIFFILLITSRIAHSDAFADYFAQRVMHKQEQLKHTLAYLRLKQTILNRNSNSKNKSSFPTAQEDLHDIEQFAHALATDDTAFCISSDSYAAFCALKAEHRKKALEHKIKHVALKQKIEERAITEKHGPIILGKKGVQYLCFGLCGAFLMLAVNLPFLDTPIRVAGNTICYINPKSLILPMVWFAQAADFVRDQIIRTENNRDKEIHSTHLYHYMHILKEIFNKTYN